MDETTNTPGSTPGSTSGNTTPGGTSRTARHTTPGHDPVPPPPDAGGDSTTSVNDTSVHTTDMPTEAASAYGAGVTQFGYPETAAQPHPKSRRGRTLMAGLAIGAILGGGAGAGAWALLDDDEPAQTPATTTANNTGSGDGSVEKPASLDSVQDVAARIQPSVVSITVSGQFGEGGGTGVILSEDGRILTNNHVVQSSDEVMVTFSDGTTANAEVVATDPVMDLAVIQADDVSGLTPAELGSSGDLAVGEQVVAIGSPLGLEGTVTTGIVSALQRPVSAGGEGGAGGKPSHIDAIQTDAPINPGNSGGPLVNMAGQVIGINTAILTDGASSGSIGLGFAIPIDQAKPIVEELVETGQATHAQIGVTISTPQNGSPGAQVREVTSGSAADDAGLQEGDVITKLDDRLIVNPDELIAAVRSYRPDDETTVTFVRDGEEQAVQVTLGSDTETT